MLKRGLPRLNYTWLRKRNGFFLIDSITAVLVLAIGLAAMAALFTYGIRYAKSASDEQKAVQIAAESIERIKVSEAEKASISAIEEVVTKINSDKTVIADDQVVFYRQVTISDKLESMGGEGDDTLYLVTSKVWWPDENTSNPETTVTLYTYVRSDT